jgi:hypothetical protein
VAALFRVRRGIGVGVVGKFLTAFTVLCLGRRLVSFASVLTADCLIEKMVRYSDQEGLNLVSEFGTSSDGHPTRRSYVDLRKTF